MKRSICIPAALVTALLALSSCASMEWVSSARKPIIAQLSTVTSLGVASYPARLKANDHLLVKAGGSFYAAIELGGVQNKVAMRYTSPDVVSKFSVNAQNLAALCRKAWVAELANKDFDFIVSKGNTPNRIMSQSLTGEAAAGGYTSVVDITDLLAQKTLTADTIKALGQKYNVGAILILDPGVYGEVGRVVAEQGEMPTGKQVKVGGFILRGLVDYRYELYDTQTGAKITDSNKTSAEFDTMLGFQQMPDTIVDLNATTEPAVTAYLNGPKHLDAYAVPAKMAITPWLTLFKPHYLATMQKAEKK